MISAKCPLLSRLARALKAMDERTLFESELVFCTAGIMVSVDNSKTEAKKASITRTCPRLFLNNFLS